MLSASGAMAVPGSAAFDAAVVGDRHDPGEDGGHRDVEDRADDERGDDADRQVAAGVLGLLRRGRDGVEADVGEEDDRPRGHDPGPAVGRERRPVLGLHELEAGEQEEEHGGQLDRDHGRVEARALADADHQQGGDRQHDQHRGEVDHRAGHGARGRAHPGRQVPAEAGQDALEVAAPADRDGHGPDRVLEDQVPADRPRDDLAERRVGVGVGAAGDRDHRRELGVAESREGAGEPGRHVGDRDRGPRLVRGGGAGEHEDAGADDRADAEEGEVERGERPLQVLPLLDVVDELLDRLGLQQVRVQSSSCGSCRPERRRRRERADYT